MNFCSKCIVYGSGIFYYLLFASSATYANTTRDLQSWFNLTMTGHFNQESHNFDRFRYWIEGQERLGDEIRRFSQTIARTGLGYTITDNTSLWVGYAWIHTGAPFTNQPFSENRIWEQIIWNKSFKFILLSSRTRLEQRFLPHPIKTAYRVRQLVKVIKPFNHRPQLRFVSSEEVFWHKNNYIGRNGQGFDQNRLFIGFGYQFSAVLQTEIGYMNQYIRRFGVPNFFNNVFAVTMIMNS